MRGASEPVEGRVQGPAGGLACGRVRTAGRVRTTPGLLPGPPREPPVGVSAASRHRRAGSRHDRARLPANARRARENLVARADDAPPPPRGAGGACRIIFGDNARRDLLLVHLDDRARGFRVVDEDAIRRRFIPRGEPHEVSRDELPRVGSPLDAVADERDAVGSVRAAGELAPRRDDALGASSGGRGREREGREERGEERGVEPGRARASAGSRGIVRVVEGHLGKGFVGVRVADLREDRVQELAREREPTRAQRGEASAARNAEREVGGDPRDAGGRGGAFAPKCLSRAVASRWESPRRGSVSATRAPEAGPANPKGGGPANPDERPADPSASASDGGGRDGGRRGVRRPPPGPAIAARRSPDAAPPTPDAPLELPVRSRGDKRL